MENVLVETAFKLLILSYLWPKNSNFRVQIEEIVGVDKQIVSNMQLICPFLVRRMLI